MQAAWVVGGVSAAVAAVGLAALVRTRWLQSRTLEKCVGISIAVHALLAIVCAFVGGMAPASWGTRDEGRMTMQVVLSEEDDAPAVAEGEAPVPEPEQPESDAPPAAIEPASIATAAAAPPPDLVPLLEPPVEAAVEPEFRESAAVAGDSRGTARAGSGDRGVVAAAPPVRSVPAVYADRVGARRAAAAAARGGSQETERAVEAALGWLAAAQAADGRWSAATHGAGRGRVGSQHRPETGARSDHGVTGLALLAFLGAGSTHRDGPHAAQVDRGLRFLVERQKADGSLAGDAEFFAALYCHGMATLALAECAALTGDAALAPPLDSAIRHTLATQHPVTGGWRYGAGDRGDTSQLGWQVMAIESAAQAGIGGLEPARARAGAFLASVSSGAAGGLASYRPGERPSAAMTAEALVCRLFLGLPAGHPAVAEALGAIGRAPPDRSNPNAYTWYYATLASFHAGGPQWDEWNRQLQAELLSLQRREGGALDGSWDPDPVWGGHGGRVYSTALSAMTLEVYYRHLPMHERAARVAAAP